MEQKVCLDHSVVIKAAEPNDLPDVFALIDTYNGETMHDKTMVKNNVRDMVYMQGVMLVEYNGEVIGGIAGYVTPSMYTSDIILSIMFFYVRHGFRHLTKKIIDELELVMLPTSVTKIVFGILAHDNVHYEKQIRYFKMAGYHLLETHLFKRI